MKKMMQYVIVGIILLITAGTYLFVHPENWLKNNQTVSTAEITQTPMADYAGKISDGNLPLLQTAEEFAALKTYDYVIVKPLDVIGTGVYELKHWVNPNELKKRVLPSGRTYTSGAAVPMVTTSAVGAVEYYNEYYLIKLPDNSYIPALFDSQYASAIKKGDAVILPIGKRLQTTKNALSPLQSVCAQYSANSKNTLYMLDDQWNKANKNNVFWIRVGISAGVFVVLSIAAALLFSKVFSE